MTDLMIEWQQFLLQQGANFSNEGVGQLLGFNGKDNFAAENDFIAPLNDLGLIAWTGDEAAQFLHNQLTNDVGQLGTGEVRLGGYCTPKGRLMATMLYWRTDNEIFLQLPKPMLPAIQKRLQMFVLRTKAKPRDASDEFVTLGLIGNAASKSLQTWFPQLPEAPYAKCDSEAGTVMRLTDANGAPRYQWVTRAATAIQAWPLLMNSLQAVGPQAWRLADIRAGIPTVVQQTQEQFVPQMINFELIGGVNFKKGCYPGQRSSRAVNIWAN